MEEDKDALIADEDPVLAVNGMVDAASDMLQLVLERMLKGYAGKGEYPMGGNMKTVSLFAQEDPIQGFLREELGEEAAHDVVGVQGAMGFASGQLVAHTGEEVEGVYHPVSEFVFWTGHDDVGIEAALDPDGMGDEAIGEGRFRLIDGDVLLVLYRF